MANRNWASGGRKYAMHVSPVSIDCNFIVDATDPNGITDLKGPTVSSVLMNSSHATPTQVIATGLILIELADNYNKVLSVSAGSVIAPTTGAEVKVDNSALTAGVAYVITTVGNSTAAQMHSIGLPAGITPAAGVGFIASAVGISGEANTSTTRVKAVANTNVAAIELISDPTALASPDPRAAQGYGASLILRCLDFAGAAVAPTAGTTIQITMEMNNSSIQVAGE